MEDSGMKPIQDVIKKVLSDLIKKSKEVKK